MFFLGTQTGAVLGAGADVQLGRVGFDLHELDVSALGVEIVQTIAGRRQLVWLHTMKLCSTYFVSFMLIPESRKSLPSLVPVPRLAAPAKSPSEPNGTTSVGSSKGKYSALQIDGVDFFWPRLGILGGASLGNDCTRLSGATKAEALREKVGRCPI